MIQYGYYFHIGLIIPLDSKNKYPINPTNPTITITNNPIAIASNNLRLRSS